MADDRFSLDDILNEYSNKTKPVSGMTINMDELLRGIENAEKEYNEKILPDTVQIPKPEQESEYFQENVNVQFNREAMARLYSSEAPPPPIEPEPPVDPELEKRRMELIQKEIISGDYEHKYLGEDYKDVIEEEKRRKERRRARNNSAAEDTAQSFAENIFYRPEKPAKAAADTDTAMFSRSEAFFNGSDENESVVIMNDNNAPKEEKAPKPKRERRRSRWQKDDEDDFQKKYDELIKRGLGVKSRSEREASRIDEDFDAAVEEMERHAGPGRTFSEKAESNSYEDDFTRVVPQRKIMAVASKQTGLISYTQNDKTDEEIRDSDDPLDSCTDHGSLAGILSEYDRKKAEGTAPIAVKGSHSGINNTFTDIFGKLMKPDENPDGTKAVSGNTELLDGMKKIKQERLQRTTNIPPIERKTISDIDLNLKDKIIHDTAPIEAPESKNETEKLRELSERRSKKISNFVFAGAGADNSFSDEDDERSIEDFERMDDAMSIANDIAQLKGTMLIRLAVLIICFGVSLYITLANETGAPIINLLNMQLQPATYLFVNTLIGMFAAFMSYTVISSGLSKLISLKADCDSLCTVTVLSTIILSVMAIGDTSVVRSSMVHEYVPIGIAVLVFNTIGKLLILDRTQRNFKFVSGDTDHYAVFMTETQEQAETFTRGVLTEFPLLASMKKTELISDFMKTSYSADSSDRFCRIFTPVVLIASLLIGLLGTATGDSIFVGLSSFTGCMCLCSCFSMMLVVNLPMQKASKKYSEMQGALIGFDSIDEYSETNSVMIDAAQLFPKGSITLAGMKIFSDTRIDEAIVEAASLATQSGSVLKNMFYDIIAGRTEMLNPVESYIFEDSMGLCSWINNKRVLLGNRKLMENHSINGMPSEEKEAALSKKRKVPVYLSISGELSAMFIVEIKPVPEVVHAMRELERKHIKVIIRSVDSVITHDRVAEIFRVSPSALKILPFSVHSDFENITAYTPRQSATLACSGRFAALSALIIGTRRIRGTVSFGMALQAISILLGILLAALMVLLKSFADLSVAMILFYNLIFTVIYLIANLFRRV